MIDLSSKFGSLISESASNLTAIFLSEPLRFSLDFFLAVGIRSMIGKMLANKRLARSSNDNFPPKKAPKALWMSEGSPDKDLKS